MPSKKVHEVDLVRPDQLVGEHGTIGQGEISCLMCGMAYSAVDYDILFKVKKLAYFDVSCLNFWDAKQEEFKEDDNVLTTTISVRAHNPELTLDVSRNITITPNDVWLESIFNQHSVDLEVHIFNED